MTKALYDTFQEALEAIQRGESLEDTLKAHAVYAQELRPLLEAAITATKVAVQAESDSNMRERSRTRMLQYAAQQRTQGSQRLPLLARWRSSFAALIVAAIILLSSTGIWVASAQSLPGDPFYGLKLRAEEINRTLVSNKSSRYELEIQYRQRRVDEVQRLLDTQRVEAVEFEGILQAQNASLWDVANVVAIVHADTDLNGPFSLGDEVEVQGVTTTSGAVLATSIELRRYQLIGAVDKLEGANWVIADRRIDMQTAIVDPGITLGAWVQVEVEVDDAGIHKGIIAKPITTAPSTELEDTSNASMPEGDEIDDEEKIKVEGRLESMSASAIQINGQTLYLIAETEIDGVLTPGVSVSVEAVLSSDGTWIALEIEVEERDADEDTEELDSDQPDEEDSDTEEEEEDDTDKDEDESDEEDEAEDKEPDESDEDEEDDDEKDDD